MKASRKQALALNLLDDPSIVDLLFGGGAGGGKSLLMCIWLLLQMRNYPGIRIGLGRKEITRLKETTVVTMLNEAHPLLGVQDYEFKYSGHKNRISYINGSVLLLVDLAHQPSDPEGDRFGSLNLTHAAIEEVGEVAAKERNLFISRKNRYLNQKYGIVGKSVSTCNPSQNYIKEEYYKQYKKLGAGDYQKWPYGEVEFNGEMHPAYRAFIRSIAADNPFLSRNYIEVLKKLPLPEMKRLLKGDWDFESDDFMLFKGSLLDRVIEDHINTGPKAFGFDIADAGSDRTIGSIVEAGMLIEQFPITVDKDKAIGEQIAMEIIKVAQQNGLSADNAKQIGIDVIGVGASTRDFLRSKGWYVSEFVAGAGVEEITYKNLRGKTIYEMSQAMDRGEFKIYSGLQTLEDLRTELMAHSYTTEERKIIVTPKKEIKETLAGKSPDHAESAYIAYWASLGDTDPMNSSDRVDF